MTEYGSPITYKRDHPKERDFTESQERRIKFLITQALVEFENDLSEKTE